MKYLTYMLYFIVSFFVLVLIIGYMVSAPAYKGDRTDNFDGSKFQNSTGIASKGFGDVLKWALNRDKGQWTDLTDQDIAVKPDPDATRKVTFVNHATFLIQTESLTLLTDPVWSERTSPVNWAGPKRMRSAGVNYEDLPDIDVVIISHNHYDHLDIKTLTNLNRDHAPLFVVPLGVGAYLNQHKISNVRELNWEQSTDHENVRITAVEAQHFSGRGFFDRDKTLWCGFMIQDGEKRLYFAGDTGYGPFFKRLGEDYGPVDLSMIPIGAYKPRWFMSPIHVAPDEAVRAHLDIRSTRTIAMHYGTFPLADDGMQDPVDDLQKALADQKVQPEAFLTLGNGQSVSY